MNRIIAFCHLRKTGGITFNHILRREHGCSHLDAIKRQRDPSPQQRTFYRPTDLQRDLRLYPRLRSIAGHDVSPSVDYGEIGKRFVWFTMLRDPVRRYVSHFVHHVEKMGCRDDFATWMNGPKQHNDQVKTIAGCADLEQAKKILDQSCWVGFLEHYDLSLVVFRTGIGRRDMNIHYPREANRSRGTIDTKRLISQYERQIRENNLLDLELYEYAKSVIWPRQIAGMNLDALEAEARGLAGQADVWRDRLRLLGAKVKRNLLYKPFVRWSRGR